MELKYLLILMVLLYLVPELLRRRKPKKYEYPDIPERVPKAPVINSAPIIFEEPKKPTIKTPIAMPPAVHMPAIREESPWQGKINLSVVQNGYIFSEILQPPRAYRPIGLNSVLLNKRRPRN